MALETLMWTNVWRCYITFGIHYQVNKPFVKIDGHDLPDGLRNKSILKVGIGLWKKQF